MIMHQLVFSAITTAQFRNLNLNHIRFTCQSDMPFLNITMSLWLEISYLWWALNKFKILTQTNCKRTLLGEHIQHF